MHNVHEHHQAQPVRLVNERLQLLRGAKPAAGLQSGGGMGRCGVGCRGAGEVQGAAALWLGEGDAM